MDLLIQHPIQIFTDHKPLLHCFTKRQPQPTILSCSNAINKILQTYNHPHIRKKTFLLLICSVDLLRKLNFNKTNLNTNNNFHKLILLFYKIKLFNPYITLPIMKKCYLIKIMIPIVSLPITAQTNFQYVLMTKAMMSLLSFYTSFPLNLLHLSI